MDEENTTYDYSNYYSQTSNDMSGLCSNVKVRQFGSVFIPMLYGVVFLVGFVGNGLVVWVLLNQKLRTMTDICLFNLAVSDLLFVVSLPFMARDAAVSNWEFGEFMCWIVSLMFLMGFYANIFFIVVMSVDRYMIIVHAVTMARHRSIKLGIVVVGIVWAMSFFTSLPTIVFTQVVKNESGFDCTATFPQGSIWKLFAFYELNVLGLIIPLIVMVFCYSKIIPTLVNIKTKKKHKAIRLVLVIVLVFFFFWTPYNVVCFLQSLLYLRYIESCDVERGLNYALYWTTTLAFTHCCLNPVIYAFAGQKFKKLVLKMLHKWFACQRCEPHSSELSDRRSSLYSRSSEITSARLL